VIVGGWLWMERMFFKSWVHPESFFSRSTPLNRVLSRTPLVGALRMTHARAHHFQYSICFLGGFISPNRRNGVVRFHAMIYFLPPVFGIIMHKDRAVPAAIQSLWPTMETFRWFVKENITRCEQNFMCATVKVLNENGPRISVLGRVNVQNETDNVCLRRGFWKTDC